MDTLPASARLAGMVLLTVPCLVAAGESRNPRLKWLSAASSLSLERWGGSGAEGNGPLWKARSVLYNPPQTLTYLHLGAGLGIHPKAVLSATVPLFRNSIEAYTSSRSGLPVRGQRAAGVGDIEVALALCLGAFSLRPVFAAPWAYEAGFLEPWRGLGVYRAGLGAATGAGPHAGWVAGDMVILKPGGGNPGLVEPLDFALKSGYVFSRPLTPRFAAKAGADLSFTSFGWAGDAPQHNYSLDLRLALAFAPRPGHALALSGTATLYSYQGGSRTYHTYASRRIGLGLQYGRYF